MVGQTISHYKILDKIGEGGMGVVYEAEDTRLHRRVALKILRPETSDDEGLRARLSKEAEIAASLDHPNITTVYEIDEAGGHTFLAMPLITGETVAAKIKRRPLPLNEALEIGIQIAAALQAAHSNGVVHRDVKPGNVMVTSEGRVKVMDFGLAHLAGQTHITKTGTVLGTPAYMSPEQAQGLPADARSDIWSLGIVIYEMVTGQQPFHGENSQSVMYSIVHDEHEPITALRVGVPPELDRIVGKALAKRPQDRYQHVDDMVVDLRTVGRGGSPVVRRTVSPLLSRRELVYGSVAVALVVLAVALGMNVDWLRSRFFSGGAGQIESIAILPLQNLSGDASQQYFSDGMTETLYTDLAKISALKVVSPRSTRKYEGTNTTIRQIADELGVDAIVQGSAVRTGNQVRITAQLIDADTDENLWAESYARDFQDVLVLQNEVARAIARQIQVELTSAEALRLSGARQVDPDAYEAYLRGNFENARLTGPGFDAALEHNEIALKHDPKYAPAYAGIACVWSGRQQMGLAPPQEAGLKMREAVIRALELDSSLAESQYALACFRAWTDWDWEGAGQAFRRAIEINPNYADAHAFYSHLLVIVGRPEEALTEMERAMQLDPSNLLFRSLYGMDLNFARRYDDAIAQLRETLATPPGHPLASSTLRVSYHHKAMFEEAYEGWRAAYAEGGDNEMVDAMSRGYAENGYHGAMLSAAELMVERSRTTRSRPWQIATLYVRAGKHAESIEWFEKAYEDRDPNMPYLGADPLFDALHSYPRYQDLLRRMGLPSPPHQPG